MWEPIAVMNYLLVLQKTGLKESMFQTERDDVFLTVKKLSIMKIINA